MQSFLHYEYNPELDNRYSFPQKKQLDYEVKSIKELSVPASRKHHTHIFQYNTNTHTFHYNIHTHISVQHTHTHIPVQHTHTFQYNTHTHSSTTHTHISVQHTHTHSSTTHTHISVQHTHTFQYNTHTHFSTTHTHIPLQHTHTHFSTTHTHIPVQHTHTFQYNTHSSTAHRGSNPPFYWCCYADNTAEAWTCSCCQILPGIENRWLSPGRLLQNRKMDFCFSNK